MSKMLKRKFDDDMDSPSGGRVKQDELEVTGVSRSGRVRKKSSKLMDFESPDDIDNRYRRRGGDSFSSPVPSSSSGRGRGRGSTTLHPDRTPSSTGVQHRDTLTNDAGEDIYSSSDELTADVHDEESSSSSSSSENDDEAASDADRLIDDRNTVSAVPVESNSHVGDEAHSGVGTASRGGQSLYMLEKSSKKKLVVRNGRVVGRTKAQRKDKGKSRFTAYMLWAKEVRQEILRANPDTDFATISKRLGELWATVPNNEKYAWKRRAKRVALTKPATEAPAQSSVTQGLGGSGQQPESGRWRSRSKFINKAGAGPSTSTTSASARQDSSTAAGVMSVAGAAGSGSRGGAGTSVSSGTGRHHQQQQQQQVAETKTGASAGASGGRGLVAEPAVGPGLYKVVGTQPVDVAAHLKLLGESLGIIGERLKEHEGQIAVSGSLSVLLDSLLCALGPLICLTRQLPETNSCPPEMLSKLLDNIAYFMPGL